MPGSWAPRDFPKEYTLYHKALQSKDDEYMLLIAFMECTGIYDDEGLEEYKFLLEDSVCTVRTMPDLCVPALHVKLWQDPQDDLGAPDQLYWANILTCALPNPCKGRSINNKLAQDVLSDPCVYDAVLRIIFGSFLGVYSGTPASFETRVMCYAAFSLYAPTPQELSAFLLRRKVVVTFCFRAYLLYLMGLTSMKRWLCTRYEWQLIENIITQGMDEFRGMLSTVAYGPGFLTTNPEWEEIDAALLVVNKAYKKHVFRPADQPFYKRVLREMQEIQRIELKEKTKETRVTSLPVPKISEEDLLYVMAFRGLVTRSFARAVTDVRKWGHLSEEETVGVELAQTLYEKEIKMTAARKFLFGNKDGLFFTNRAAYERLQDFFRACDIRLKAKWGVLPEAWKERQEQALLERTGEKHNPIFFFCPKCSAIRSVPVIYPNGRDFKSQRNAFYSKGIRLDLGTMQHYCAAKNNERRKSAILRRRNRGANTLHLSGDDIVVCDGTPVFPVAMLGVLFYTDRDGLLLLCVDCACIMAFTPECMSARGPTCGCLLPKEPGLVTECAVCENTVPTKKTRVQTVLTEEGVEVVRICRSHWTGYANDKHFMFTVSMLRLISENNYRVKMGSDKVPFFMERN